MLFSSHIIHLSPSLTSNTMSISTYKDDTVGVLSVKNINTYSVQAEGLQANSLLTATVLTGTTTTANLNLAGEDFELEETLNISVPVVSSTFSTSGTASVSLRRQGKLCNLEIHAFTIAGADVAVYNMNFPAGLLASLGMLTSSNNIQGSSYVTIDASGIQEPSRISFVPGSDLLAIRNPVVATNRFTSLAGIVFYPLNLTYIADI